MLRECLAMGADEAYLMSDRAFGGADTCATSTTLAAGIRKVPGVDVIFGGRQAIDGDTAQVGPQVAQRLGIPVVTYVQDIRLEDGKLTVQRQMEDGYEVVEVKMPCFLTCVKELNTPRYMKHPENEETLEAAYDELESDLLRRIEGLNRQIAMARSAGAIFLAPPCAWEEVVRLTMCPASVRCCQSRYSHSYA